MRSSVRAVLESGLIMLVALVVLGVVIIALVSHDEQSAAGFDWFSAAVVAVVLLAVSAFAGGVAARRLASARSPLVLLGPFAVTALVVLVALASRNWLGAALYGVPVAVGVPLGARRGG